MFSGCNWQFKTILILLEVLQIFRQFFSSFENDFYCRVAPERWETVQVLWCRHLEKAGWVAWHFQVSKACRKYLIIGFFGRLTIQMVISHLPTKRFAMAHGQHLWWGFSKSVATRPSFYNYFLIYLGGRDSFSNAV